MTDPQSLPHVEIEMIRPNMIGIPQAAFPAGYGMRTMRLEEAPLWTEIQREADLHSNITDDLFMNQFGNDVAAIPERCYFIVREDGLAVGAISAWHGREFREGDYGRIHWFGIRPAFQGRGLARPALSYAMNRLAEWYQRAWLTTGTMRLKALKLYLDYGFLPLLDGLKDRGAWRAVQGVLQHPALEEALGG